MNGIELNPTGLIDRAALEFLQSKKLLAGFSHYDVWLNEHAVAFTVAKMMEQDLLAEVKAAIESAIANGTDFNTFKNRLKPYLMKKGWWGEQIRLDPVDGVEKVVQLGSTRRLELIFKTNTATAYAAGQWQRIQANKKALPYLRYNPSAAHQPRDSHKRYYNLVLPVDHPIWAQIFPPNGYGCLCSVSQLTQKQAEKIGITENPRFEMEQKTNPRTGEVATVPKNITASFAHNHGDRLGNLTALFGEKHGKDALDTFIARREAYLSERFTLLPGSGMQTTTLPDVSPDDKEVKRLVQSKGSNNTALHEVLAAVAWQKAFNAKLEVYDLPNPTPPDFLIVDSKLAREQWQTIDFMFTMDADNAFKIEQINKNFALNDDAWKGKKTNIQRHLAKSDIVPLDLRYLNAINRLKLLQYVLSLPKEQRDRIRLIVKESK